MIESGKDRYSVENRGCGGLFASHTCRGRLTAAQRSTKQAKGGFLQQSWCTAGSL